MPTDNFHSLGTTKFPQGRYLNTRMSHVHKAEKMEEEEQRTGHISYQINSRTHTCAQDKNVLSSVDCSGKSISHSQKNDFKDKHQVCLIPLIEKGPLFLLFLFLFLACCPYLRVCCLFLVPCSLFLRILELSLPFVPGCQDSFACNFFALRTPCIHFAFSPVARAHRWQNREKGKKKTHLLIGQDRVVVTALLWSVMTNNVNGTHFLVMSCQC